ncbi:hypothetical protein [Clostridium sp. Marseille-Q2269]|nr:hypothetical protein [Clostridium sp. Marseille-Q2269]
MIGKDFHNACVLINNGKIQQIDEKINIKDDNLEVIGVKGA